MAGIWAGLFVLLQMRVVDDMDILFQVVLGRAMLELGTWPPTETLCFPLAGSPFVPMGWLAQLGAALTDRVGGLYGLQLIRSFLYATALLLAAALSFDGRSRKPIGMLLGVTLAFPVFMTSANLRPQAAILPLFFLVMHLAVGGRPLWQKTLAAAVIGLLWQNLHASLPAGIAALLLLSVGSFISSRRSHSDTEPAIVAAPWHHPLALALILALTQIATPLGSAIFALSRTNYTISAQCLGITEWLPAWHPDMAAHMFPFWVAFFATTVLFALRPGCRRPVELALALPFAVLTTWSSRFVFFWAPLMVPIWGRWAETAWEQRFPSGTSSSLKPHHVPVAHGVAVISTLLVGILLPLIFSPLERSQVPHRAVQALVRYAPAGRVYNFREWSGPLVYFSNGAWKPAIDGRLYLFPLQTWVEYQAAASGELTVAGLSQKFAPDAFFLHPTYHAALIAQLQKEAAWRQIWADTRAVVFVPNR